ncbi:MAG: glycosyltransferase family 4 protein [Chromatiaceae bacterium]|nr:glycosyltransferase family 4 protein [Gammaproteobacteria bacterium]MCP5300223.1 glycosyltransferase family 4 protein [Chromatiaceae bacterium]MCP5422295.1 glycosyltransferase family 4 protein [Chromatiaceae bacterium]
MVRPLTVLQMLPALHGGGVERGTLEVAQALVEQGHRSLVMSAGGGMVDELLAHGSEHLCWPVDRKSLWTLRLVRPLRRLLRERSVDILHLRSRAPAWVGWLAWRGIPVDARPHLVTTVHGLYSVNAYSRVMTRGERVIAVSETVRDYVLDNYPGFDPGHMVVIPRGVDPAVYRYGWQPENAWLDRFYAEFPQLRGRTLLTLPGRLTRLKGHHEFIDLIAALRSSGEQVHGLIVGGEDPRRAAYAAELRRRVSDGGLSDDITFTGRRSDMREVYAVSAIVYSLSGKPESFGRTVLEALSMGRPVIGYAHGGVGEVLAKVFPDGCVALKAVDALVARSRGFLANPPVVSFEQPYTLERMLTATLELYEYLAEGQ